MYPYSHHAFVCGSNRAFRVVLMYKFSVYMYESVCNFVYENPIFGVIPIAECEPKAYRNSKI